MNEIFIIGGGPAGLTAGIYAASAGFSVTVADGSFVGGNMAIAPVIGNYPGFGSVNGYELAKKMQEQAKNLGVNFISKAVSGFNVNGDKKIVTLKDGSSRECDAVIICTGTKNSKLECVGVDRFEGKGISYCAVCDGNFFRNKDVMVVGGGDKALKDAMYLAKICKKVYLVHPHKDVLGIDDAFAELEKIPNTEIIPSSVVNEVGGGSALEYAVVEDKLSGNRRNIEISGLFCAIGVAPQTELFEDFIETDKNGYAVADEDCKTSVGGVFVAGDVRKKKLKQILTAAADGANAAISAIQYIKNKR